MLTFSSGIDTELGHAVLVKTATASSPVPLIIFTCAQELSDILTNLFEIW